MEELQVQVSNSDDFVEMDDCSLGGRVIVVASSPKGSMNYEKCEDKAQEIRECLQLHSESCGGTVDLWELRQLAISPGGLLSPALRQVAWPLLAGLSTSNLEDNSDDEIYEPLDETVAESVQKDIEASVWNLDELVRQSQTGKEGFWYSPLLHANNTADKAKGDAPPGLVLSSPCSSSETSQDESRSTGCSIPEKTKSISTPTPQDQIILKKMLTQVFQGQSEYPVAGLADLASLLVINLESTEVASLLLSRLTTYLLKAAFGGATLESMQTAMQLLLKEFQPQMAVNSTEKALAWFSSVFHPNPQASSRLIDAFLVSHPLFPLYFGAASAGSQASWTSEIVEELISKALEYM